jgi:alkanesulfonate monooxygenase SsuD/methylene tetrahydromethanopterin reductase-like flavin-dependent oxidoreductase (luciferase family)
MLAEATRAVTNMADVALSPNRYSRPTMRIGVKPGPWGWAFEELRDSWRMAEDAGFDLISCFDHVTSSPSGAVAWEAPSLLVAMAGVTTRAALAVHVVNAAIRHSLLLAGQIAVAQAASGGRIEVGLGAGSYHLARFDHIAAGLPFPQFDDRLQRLEACCRTLPRLWSGETVDDEILGLRSASLGPLGIDPPRLVVGGLEDRTMTIAVRYADAWNASEPNPAAYAELLIRLDEVVNREARRQPLERQVQFWLRAVGLEGVRDRLDAFRDLGVDTAVVVLDEERGAEWVRRLADAVLG